MQLTHFKPYPWQLKNWEMLCLAHHTDRIAHAILFSGAVGIGLEHFVECLVTGLLCEQTTEPLQACGECRSCRLIHSGNHPDLLKIQLEEKKQQIKIDDIKRLIDFNHLKSQYGRYRISVIYSANLMNRNAANALLKILEEPSSQSLIILISYQPTLLPITIRSRCQKINFKPAFDDKTILWVEQFMGPGHDHKQLLTLTKGAPLAIKELLENDALKYQRYLLKDMLEFTSRQDAVKIAEKWSTYGNVKTLLLWLSQLLNDMIRIKCLMSPIMITEATTIEYYNILVKSLELRQLSTFYELLLDKYNLSNSIISYNEQGMLEDIIIFWQYLVEQT